MKSLRRKLLLIETAISLGASTIAAADIVTLTPIEDATISEKEVGLPQGSASTLNSGTTGPNEGALKNRALLKFNVASSIPVNAIVTSATLTLTTVQSPTTTNLFFTLHKVLPAWSESAVTWTNRLSPPAAWSAPGAAPPLDYSSSATQSNLVAGLGPFTLASNPSMVADLQDWVRNPANNAGWIIICEREDLERSVRKFASREAFNSTNRPSLEVQFTLPVSPLMLTLLPQTNGWVQFQFNAESNRSYTVVYTGDAGATNWITLTNITPLAAPADILVSDSLTVSNRFYRVQTP
jgi:hypothetical protein